MTNPEIEQSNKTDGAVTLQMTGRLSQPALLESPMRHTRCGSLNPPQLTGCTWVSTLHTQGSPLPPPISRLSDHD
jgi:hypothetical protein